MGVAVTQTKKPLGVRVTADQHRIITEAAKREHRSVSNFVLSAALKAAEPKLMPSQRFTDEESAAIVREAQESFRASTDRGRDLVEELFAERRADATRG